MRYNEEPFHPPLGLFLVFAVLAGLGGAAFVIGISSDPQRVWANLYLAGNYLAWLGVGALVLIAIDAVTGARWSLPLRRLQEACVAALPAAAVIVLAVMLIQSNLFNSADALAGAENRSTLRSLWLDRPFLLARAVVYFGLWLLFALVLIRAARSQEHTGLVPWDAKSVRLAAAFLVVFGVTCWLGSYDWLMALQPGWSSSIFGVYSFAGAFLSALAAVTLLAVVLRHRAPLRAFLTEERLHILGTLLFSFSSFWMYTWYCQYMLIWYTNHPDETSYFRQRSEGIWPAMTIASLVLNWAIQFLVLMPRWTKGNGIVLAFVSVLLLGGRWLDLFVIIGPSQNGAMTPPGLIEAGIGLVAVGVLGLSAFWSLGRLPLVPANASQLGLEATVPPLPAAE